MHAAGSHIVDLQPYGDRVDLLVNDVPAARKQLATIEDGGGQLSVYEQEPTLENVFVCRLQAVESKPPVIPFPYAEGSQRSSGLAIGATNISKKFGDFQAVKNVSLQVDFGQIFGLLGANGAGKTTTIKILCGLLEASAGQMMLAGAKSDLRNPVVRQQIGYMSQKFTLYDDLTVLENLQFYCGVYDVPEDLKQPRIDWVIKTCGLSDQEKLITGQLPGGWKQRVSFAASIMHQPNILFLDEPTSGVDPLARRQLWKLIRDVAAKGTAVLVTTHFLEEAEFCQKLAFIGPGEIVAQGSPSEIKQSQPGQLIEMRTSNNRQTVNLLRAHFAPWRVSIFGDTVHLVLDQPDSEMVTVESILSQNSVQKLSTRHLPFSLEDAFIGIVQRAGQNAGRRMNRIGSQAVKELRQFQRDKLTVLLAFVLPFFSLLMFGGVTRLESKDIAFAVINFDSGKLSRDLIDTLFANQQVRAVAFEGSGPLTPLDRGQAEGTLVIPPEFSRRIKQGIPTHIQLAIDASDVNNARVLKGGVLATVDFFARTYGLMKGAPFIHPRLRLWFNPGRRESLFIVPGAYALIVWIFPSLLSALSLSREKEQGTMLQLYASSLSSRELVAGKAIAYLVVGLAEALLLLASAMIIFGTRFAGNPLVFALNTVVYVLAAVMFGQLAAARTSTSPAAMQLTATVGFTTAFLLSGFIYPVRNIAFPFNYLSVVVPARYYMDVCRDAFLRGGDALAHWYIPLILAFASVVFF